MMNEMQKLNYEFDKKLEGEVDGIIVGECGNCHKFQKIPVILERTAKHKCRFCHCTTGFKVYGPIEKATKIGSLSTVAYIQSNPGKTDEELAEEMINMPRWINVTYSHMLKVLRATRIKLGVPPKMPLRMLLNC